MARLKRRTFLGGAAAGAAAGFAAYRGARADNTQASVSRVLIVNAPGGLRSSAAFNASTQADLNPWGVWTTSGSVTLGNVLNADLTGITYDAPSWPTPVIPDLATIASDFALVGATDHAPDGSHRAGDHTDDSPRMATGYYAVAGAAGLLTVINRAVGADADAPVAVIGATGFGIAPGDWLAHAPIELVYYQMPDQPPDSGHPDVGLLLETALDERHTNPRRAQARQFLDTYRGTKDTLRRFGPLLADPALHLNGNGDAEVDGITNQMLLEATGDTGSGDARSLALALRLLQVGSPAVAISLESFDWHDNEIAEAPNRYSRYARYLAGIHFALSNIADPSGNGTLLDNTLVMTTSEFGRTASPGGFNEGGGSDHGNGPSWRYQAHAFFGGGVQPKAIAPTNDAHEPQGEVASTHSLLATVACAVGTPLEVVEMAWPSGSSLYPEAAPRWELWE